MSQVKFVGGDRRRREPGGPDRRLGRDPRAGRARRVGYSVAVPGGWARPDRLDLDAAREDGAAGVRRGAQPTIPRARSSPPPELRPAAAERDRSCPRVTGAVAGSDEPARGGPQHERASASPSRPWSRSCASFQNASMTTASTGASVRGDEREHHTSAAAAGQARAPAPGCGSGRHGNRRGGRRAGPARILAEVDHGRRTVDPDRGLSGSAFRRPCSTRTAGAVQLGRDPTRRSRRSRPPCAVCTVRYETLVTQVDAPSCDQPRHRDSFRDVGRSLDLHAPHGRPRDREQLGERATWKPRRSRSRPAAATG